MSNPKISVIIPIYNVEKYLSECLDSILNQTLKEIEVICVNDGSTDDSLQILKKYSLRDNRIKIIDKENEGQGYARKVGLDNATGDYILFCDSDDYYSELTAFEKLFNYANKINSDVIAFDFYHLSLNSKVKDKILFLPKPPKKEIFTYKDIENIYTINNSPCIKLYSKLFLDSYSDWYFPKKIFYEDTPFHFQVLYRAKFSYLRESFYVYELRDNSTTTKFKIDKNFIDVYTTTKVTFDFISNLEIENKQEIYNQLLLYFLNKLNARFYKAFLNFKNAEYVINSIKIFDISNYKTDRLVYKEMSRKLFFIYKAIKRFTPEQFRDYINKKQFKEQYIKIQEQELNINRLQNSWSYRIGRIFTSPLSLLSDFFKFINDCNLIKKSGLFDSEYYLLENEDVKKANIDPIKHYLKFGWKEGRNPCAKFNGNDYLNKRPNVKVEGICPLVHYIKFGKEKK